MQAISLATKGIIGCGLPTKGIIILCITETPLKRRRGSAGVQGEVKRKIITVYYNYNDILQEFKTTVQNDLKITAENIDIQIIDNKPIVTFKIND